MGIRMNSIVVDNFKSYGDITRVPIMNLSVFMGANSSGKSTALQPLLAIKQTVECNSPDIDLLLSGKYVALGDFADVINDRDKGYFAFGIAVVGEELRENYGGDNATEIMWKFDTEAEKGACLCEVAFQISGNMMKLIRGSEHSYNIQVDGKRTPLVVKMNNLTPRRLYVEYDRQFNDLFYCFINDILRWVYPGKKGVVLPKDEMASILTIEKMYIEMMKGASNKSSARNKDGNSIQRTTELVTRIMDDLKKYCDYQFEYHASFWSIPQNFKENILFSCIYKRDDLEELIVILDKYERLIEEFPGGQFIQDYDCQAEVDISTLYRLGNKEKGSSAECDFISDAFRSYREIFHKIIGKIFYVGPIREKPQGLYNVGFETIPKYVGTTGAYFASVLLRENKSRKYILPNNECEDMSLLEALDEWAAHLNVASEIAVEKSNSFGFSVSISNTQRKKSDIMNVGIGTSQVLPVLITGLLSEPEEYLFFEQPELHLHPYSQSRLADFFVELVKRGRKITVETHSEYFVLRMRYQILAGNISERDITVNFFQNKGCTRISQGKLSGYGNLQYPDDFRDETQKLLDDLMKAALEKREQ